MESRTVVINAETQANLTQIWRRLVATDFEAAIHLKVWDALPPLVHEADDLNEKSLFARLADMLLASEAPPQSPSSHRHPWKCLTLTKQQPSSQFSR